MTNRELDAEIARKIFGCCVRQTTMRFEAGEITTFLCDCGERQHDTEGSYGDSLLSYSTDLNEAFRVIEKMREKFQQYMSVGIQGDDLDVQFHAEIDHGGLYVVDESPARAICLCALRVIDEINKLKETK